MQDLVFNCGGPEVRSDKSNDGRSLGHTCPTQNSAVILKYQAFWVFINRLCSESEQLGDLA